MYSQNGEQNSHIKLGIIFKEIHA